MKTILLTGATGSMGQVVLKDLLTNPTFKVIAIVLDTKSDHRIIEKYDSERLEVKFGDLRNYDFVLSCFDEIEYVIHLAAIIPPLSHNNPKLCMEVNITSTNNLIKASLVQTNQASIKFISIGSVAEYGDRLPPIHWARVGDPLKPSIFDYYGLSKVKAERMVIESQLSHWVSLRQTGIFCEKMAQTEDSIIFHQNLNNVLEYVTDIESSKIIYNICNQNLGDDFWNHIYNIGGGVSERYPYSKLLTESFKIFGIADLKTIVEKNWFASGNFHGVYYLDSDILENILHFRNNDGQYFFKIYAKKYSKLTKISKVLSRIKIGKMLITKLLRHHFEEIANREGSPLNAVKSCNQDRIEAFYKSYSNFKDINFENKFDLDIDFNQVIEINHGYDENKPISEFSYEDMVNVAEFHGGKLISSEMQTGDLKTKLEFECYNHHRFMASPQLIIEGGHFCPSCQSEAWNYAEEAKHNPFFAQVWYPLHLENEPYKNYKIDLYP